MMEQRSEWVGSDGVDWVDLSRGPLGVGWRVSYSYHEITGTLRTGLVLFWTRKAAQSKVDDLESLIRTLVALNWHYKEWVPNKWRMWREEKNW